ncbi:hypothetical protein [Winogradskyella helgolandensis]|uniref:hypothetical protein n=1 Tax=Winogradskyella helgolandensis TaxID=2697010 RepID=UPI0015C18B34|nr:hypothetical protein [Winogradskyella helgolandensis]
MPKFLILFIFLLFNFNAVVSQTGVDLGLNTKKSFVSITSLNQEDKLKIKDYFITDNDTLVSLGNELTNAELKMFCKCYTNDSLVNKYREAVFRMAMDNGKYRKSNQWNSDINIFIDKSIPRKVRKKFTEFYKPLTSINNLNLNFVSQVSEANYIIKESETLIENFESNITKYGENHPLSKGEYKVITDKNHKFYGATLTVSIRELEDKTLIVPKLKQLFFLSLGQFIINKTFPDTSLVSTLYNNSKIISEADLNLLNMHYFKIFDKEFTVKEFYRLLRESKRYCKND